MPDTNKFCDGLNRLIAEPVETRHQLKTPNRLTVLLAARPPTTWQRRSNSLRRVLSSLSGARVGVSHILLLPISAAAAADAYHWDGNAVVWHEAPGEPEGPDLKPLQDENEAKA